MSQLNEKSEKWVFSNNRCGWVGEGPLEAENPFERTASCGTPTKHGFMWTCYEHVPK